MVSPTTVSGCWLPAMHTVSVSRYVHFKQGTAALALLSGTHLLSSTACWWTVGGWLVEWLGYLCNNLSVSTNQLVLFEFAKTFAGFVMHQRAFCTAPAETARQM